jgi:hypothetical protein
MLFPRLIKCFLGCSSVALYPVGTSGIAAGAAADNSHPPSTEIKNAYTLSCISQMCLIKHINSL